MRAAEALAEATAGQDEVDEPITGRSELLGTGVLADRQPVPQVRLPVAARDTAVPHVLDELLVLGQVGGLLLLGRKPGELLGRHTVFVGASCAQIEGPTGCPRVSAEMDGCQNAVEKEPVTVLAW